MNFIERLLGIAPDAGTGTVEVLLLLIPFAALLAFRGVRRSLRAGRGMTSP